MRQHQSWVPRVGFVHGTVVGSEDKNDQGAVQQETNMLPQYVQLRNNPRVLGTRNERPLRNVYVSGEGGWSQGGVSR